MYYQEKLSSNVIAQRLNCEKAKVLKCLNTELRGARTIREECLLRSNDEYSDKLRKKQLGEKNNQVKLREVDVINIRKEYNDAIKNGSQKTATQHYLARKYKVKRSTISDIVLGKTWKHI